MMHPRAAFVVNDLQLSGGIGVVVAHARELRARHDIDAVLVLAREQDDPHWEHEPLEGIPVLSFDAARQERFDVAISTWWETAFVLFDLQADRYASFVQSLEDRFYAPGDVERIGAQLALNLPVAFLTEAGWIRDTLAQLRPDVTCRVVRNGVDKTIFAPPDSPPTHPDGPLRILVEGRASVWFKGVNEAVDAVTRMTEPRHLTVVCPDATGLIADAADIVLGAIPQRDLAALYAKTDVVLKLSRVEGMYGPPLEGFHQGATAVTTEVTGHEEYIRHGINALVCDWDDLRGTARQLDLLARDHELLAELRAGALETAREWPGWEQAGAEMAAALRAIVAEPAPGGAAGTARLLADVRSSMEAVRLEYAERDQLRWQLRRYQRLRTMPGIRHARALRAHPAGRMLLAAARPIVRPIKQKLLGP